MSTALLEAGVAQLLTWLLTDNLPFSDFTFSSFAVIETT
jgi:hypothetical protein